MKFKNKVIAGVAAALLTVGMVAPAAQAYPGNVVHNVCSSMVRLIMDSGAHYYLQPGMYIRNVNWVHPTTGTVKVNPGPYATIFSPYKLGLTSYTICRVS